MQEKMYYLLLPASVVVTNIEVYLHAVVLDVVSAPVCIRCCLCLTYRHCDLRRR